MDSKAWILGLVAVAMSVALAEVAWLAEAPTETLQAAARATGIGLVGLLVHAVATPVVAWLGGKLDRRTDPMDRGDGAITLTGGVGVAAALAAGVGAALLPGPWHAAHSISLCGGLVAIILSWTTISSVRRSDFEAAGPNTGRLFLGLWALPATLLLGGLVRLGLHLASGEG